jgi:Leucine-rich repeat (LRR) protein
MNPLRFLDENIFEDLKTLEVLEFAFCRLSILLPKVFFHQQKLKKIELSHNKLTHLDEDLFINNRELEEIKLGGNKLKQIDVDFTKFTKIKIIHLFDNLCINLKLPNIMNTSDVQELQENVIQNCFGVIESKKETIKFYCSL